MDNRINYTSKEKELINSLKAGDVAAVNIKRIQPTKKTPNIKNYSVEIRQRMSNVEGSSFNLLSYMNPNNPVFQSSSGVRVSWFPISAEQAVALFGVNAQELDNLPIDKGQTRLFIGKMNPSFNMPDGSVKYLQLQIVAKLLSEIDPTSTSGTFNGQYIHQNVLTTAKKAGANGRFIKGLNKDTGEIEHIIERCIVKSSTMVNDVLVKDNWDHQIIEEYVETSVSESAPTAEKGVEQAITTNAELPSLS